jgi:serine/threonine protein kinase
METVWISNFAPERKIFARDFFRGGLNLDWRMRWNAKVMENYFKPEIIPMEVRTLESEFESFRKISKPDKTGTWYSARRIASPKDTVVIKVFDQTFTASMFAKEISAISTLGNKTHENIVQLEKMLHASLNGIPGYVIVMKNIEGMDGMQFMTSTEETRRFTFEEWKTVGRKLFNALSFLHQYGIVHRNIKPSNIMFRGNVKTDPVLIGFGLSCVHDQCTTEKNIGTLGYMAPEIAELGVKSGNPFLLLKASDVWATTITLIELIMLEYPLWFQLDQKTGEYFLEGTSNLKTKYRDLYDNTARNWIRKFPRDREIFAQNFFREGLKLNWKKRWDAKKMENYFEPEIISTKVRTFEDEFELFDHYDIPFKQSAFGNLYRATLPSTKHPVAVKVFNQNATEQMMKKEYDAISASQKKNHQNIARLLDAFQGLFNKNLSYMFVLEFIEGMDGEELVGSMQKPNMTFDMWKIMGQKLFSALSLLHQYDIINRDIKPVNIIFRENVATEPVLIDFNLSCVLDICITGREGSPGYLSPETKELGQIAGDTLNLLKASDVWAMSITLFYMFSFVYPFWAYADMNAKNNDETAALNKCDPKYKEEKMTWLKRARFDNAEKKIFAETFFKKGLNINWKRRWSAEDLANYFATGIVKRK